MGKDRSSGLPRQVARGIVRTAYCDARNLFDYHNQFGLGALLYRAIQKPRTGFLAAAGSVPEERDAEVQFVRAVGVRSDAPVPSLLAMSDPDHPAGQALQRVDTAVEGELEAACQSAGIYGREDLLQLEEPQKERLHQLVANLWFWRCVEQWGQAAPKAFSAVQRALRDLESLRRGELLFGRPHHMLRLNEPLHVPPVKPHWDEESRSLSFKDSLVKRYRDHPAKIQVLVLTTFEKAGWPQHIQSPLNGPDQLRNTIRGLNKSLGRLAPLRFFGDGTGERIGWEAKPR